LKQVSATIVSNTELISGVYLAEVEAPGIADKAIPGQFLMVNCGPELSLRRPFSIHQVVDPDGLSFLYKNVGKGTAWLSQRQKGEQIDLLCPLGNGFSIKPASKHIVLVAGGIGIAPLVFLANHALTQQKSVKFIIGAATADQLYPYDLLPKGVLPPEITTEDGSYGITGMITDILPDFVDTADQIFACGPLSMYQKMSSLIQSIQPKRTVQISLEIRMGCGLGTCYGCSIKTIHGMKRVCSDGPIFNLDEIIWQEVKI
jgi:dihydroorotate dehydrogenase electron transfer subunit